ncbi:MAG: LDH2 family malate/lactate/ureidoglycolate dehydrogenase [Sphingobacteriales bacterium]|jgi:LDH2 family malate/lactate/ureidoglycolate dehydrogenase
MEGIEYKIVAEIALRAWAEKVFLAMGVKQEEAVMAANVLLAADLRGIDSHGVARLPGYVRLWKKGRIKTDAIARVVHETPSTATMDADAGLGLVASQKAMKLAIEKAKNVGSGWVAVKNSNHFGIAGFYSMMALEENMIGWAMTNASPLVAPTHSKQAMLGTNPIAVAFPAGNHRPVVIDLATSTAANGKLQIADRLGKKIPTSWAADKMGVPSDNPQVLKKGGVLFPLGSSLEGSSHKGFGLSSMVDLFSGVLSGGGFGPFVPPFVDFLEPKITPHGTGIGHFFGAWRVDAFRPLEDYKAAMDVWIDEFKNAARVDENQSIIIPGEPEYDSAKKRAIEGIPLVDNVYENLKVLSREFNIELNF